MELEKEQLNILEQQYTSFISDSNVVELEQLLGRPNIFKALKLERLEIRHSNFIGWLLDPNETHGLGDKILRQFLKKVVTLSNSGIKSSDVDTIDLESVEILRESQNIDLIIETNKFIVVVENKIFAKEHGNQLVDYIEKAKSTYKNQELIFVFLTVSGEYASDDRYIPISYKTVQSIIEDVFEKCKSTLSQRTKIYISDYLFMLKNYVMHNGEITQLSKKIYKNHRALIETLFHFREDSYSFIHKFFEKKVIESGFELGSKDNGFIRFLPKSLNNLIPKRNSPWQLNESFLFEIQTDFNGGRALRMYCTIAPGDSEATELLEKILNGLEGNNQNKWKDWLTYFEVSSAFKIDEWALKTPDEIQKFVDEQWELFLPIIKKVEEEIMKYKKDFNALSGK